MKSTFNNDDKRAGFFCTWKGKFGQFILIGLGGNSILFCIL